MLELKGALYMRELWRQRSFRWYWLGLFLSGLGDQMGWMALSWFVMERTQSPVAMGGIILAYMLPAVFAGLVAGVLLDRYDRKKLIVVDNIGRGLIFIGLVALLSTEAIPLFFVYALVVFAGILSPLSSAGAQTLLPRLVPNKELLIKANGVMESQWQMVYMLGPAVAGVLIGWIGPANVLILDATSFFLCALCFSRLPKQLVTRQDQTPNTETGAGQIVPFLRSLWADMRTGYRYLFGRKQMLLLVIFTFLFNMGYGPVEVALPLYANQDLDAGPVGLGMLWSALAVGALLGSLLFTSIRWKISTSLTLGGIIILWGLTTLPLAFFTRLEVAVLAMGLAGFCYSPYNIIYRSYLQREVPDELLGRVMTSIRTITGTGMPAGAAVCGVLIPYLGVQGLLGVGAAACVVIGIIALGLLRGVDKKASLTVD
jgi:MFS family permease